MFCGLRASKEYGSGFRAPVRFPVYPESPYTIIMPLGP